MSSYLYFIKIRMLLSLAYRFEALTTMAVQIIILLVNWFFWTAVYGGTGSNSTVAGATLTEMLTYSIIAVLLSCVFSTRVESSLRERIRKGNIAVDYIKPLSVFGMYFAEDIGESLKNFIQKFIPLLLFASIFLIVPKPCSAAHLLIFVMSACLSFLILWFIAAIFGMLNFWLIDFGPLGIIKNHIIGFLSGSIIPTWFFPEAVRSALSYTPFVYIYQYPISIFLGKVTLREAFTTLLIQLFWCGIFFTLFMLMNRKSNKNLMVQGG